MKRLMLLLFSFAVLTGTAQDFTAAEYYFDTDPGVGNGTAITLGSTASPLTFTVAIPTASLSAGFHTLAIRVQQADGAWSGAESRGLFVSSGTTDSPAIEAAEFFFDNDPGQGNATAIAVTPGDVVTFTMPIPASSSSPGFHFLAIRTRDTSGKWGLYESRGFYVSAATSNVPDMVAAEYFFDQDPGSGNGTSISVTPGSPMVFGFNPTASLLPGFHFLAVRAKDADNRWSLYESRGFYVSAAVSDAADIAEAEYFFDTDPGTGNGTAISVTPGANVNFTAPFPATGLSEGFHFLAIRTRNTEGSWSLYESRGFYVTQMLTNVPDITAAEYFIGDDPGEGLGVSLTISPNDTLTTSFVASVPDTLGPGTYTISFRVQTADGRWSHVETRTFTIVSNSPPTAQAGFDVEITLPVSSVTLDATSSNDDDGTIATYAWIQTNGAAATIVDPDEAVTEVNGLAEGVYEFEVTVTDDVGASDKDTIVVTVNPAPDVPPVADAGADVEITLPLDSVLLSAAASTDADGIISTFLWEKVSGPTGEQLATPAQSTTWAMTLSEGEYEFRVTVTDDDGLTDRDTVVVTVLPDPCPPTPVITQTNTVLTCSVSGYPIQWFMNGILMPGETNTTLEINVFEYSVYAVEVSTDECTTRSIDFVYLITDSKDEAEEIGLHPNPASTVLFVDVAPGMANQEFLLVDGVGRATSRQRLRAGRNEIDIERLPPGVYYGLVGKNHYKIVKL